MFIDVILTECNLSLLDQSVYSNYISKLKYVYYGRKTSLIHLKLNIIDFFGLHIFLRSYCRIPFIVFGWN